VVVNHSIVRWPRPLDRAESNASPHQSTHQSTRARGPMYPRAPARRASCRHGQEERGQRAAAPRRQPGSSPARSSPRGRTPPRRGPCAALATLHRPRRIPPWSRPTCLHAVGAGRPAQRRSRMSRAIASGARVGAHGARRSLFARPSLFERRSGRLGSSTVGEGGGAGVALRRSPCMRSLDGARV
jgi:hypothetical protein